MAVDYDRFIPPMSCCINLEPCPKRTKHAYIDVGGISYLLPNSTTTPANYKAKRVMYDDPVQEILEELLGQPV